MNINEHPHVHVDQQCFLVTITTCIISQWPVSLQDVKMEKDDFFYEM